MDQYEAIVPYFTDGRRKPLYYVCSTNLKKPVISIGHYETPCGGCDTLKTVDQVYDIVRESARSGFHVIYEGIMVSGESRRCIQLHKDSLPIHVIALDVPLEQCLESVRSRREARGAKSEFNPERTQRRAREVRSMMEHLKIAGVKTEWLPRDEALVRCIELFNEAI
jgi:predicted kinase